MFKLSIKNKFGQEFSNTGTVEELNIWKQRGIAENCWGKPARQAIKKGQPFAEEYDDADVLSEEEKESSIDGLSVIMVNLKAEYEISDILPATDMMVSEAYDKLNTDVYTEMEKVFGTKSAESAIAFERTWTLMKENPSLFVCQELSLASDEAVTNYANSKLQEALLYSVYRMKRIQQFKIEKAVILAQ